jgi:hypothetical protein
VEGNPVTFKQTNGDLWMNTWADDDNLYTTWGDGTGFGKYLTDIGVAKLAGTLPNIVGATVFVDPVISPAPPCDISKCKDIRRPACCLENDDKPSSMIFFNKTLYAHLHSPLGDPQIGYLASSNDYGKTWVRYKETSPWKNGSNFRCMFFVNMGKNYELNSDGYVYAFAIGREWSWNAGIYLARVKKEFILDYSKYEYFKGVNTNGEPIWSLSQNDATAMPDMQIIEQVSAMYHPGIDRYLILSSTEVYDAPNPWGPWTYAGTWVRQGWFGYQPGIISKDTESNSFWFTVAGNSDEILDVSYQLNIGKISMELNT